jgi:hypothetical protein
LSTNKIDRLVSDVLRRYNVDNSLNSNIINKLSAAIADSITSDEEIIGLIRL